MIPITYEQAVDFGLAMARSHESGPDLQPHPQPPRPILLDDSIMDYRMAGGLVDEKSFTSTSMIV